MTSRISGSIWALQTPSLALCSSNAHIACSSVSPRLPAAPLIRCACWLGLGLGLG